jgi:hypothetical protein
MTATPAPTLSVPSFRFGADATDPERLASAVLASPRLLATTPAGPLTELFRAYEGATKAAAAARLLPAEDNADAVADLDAKLRRGEEIDPAALVEKLAAAQVARESRDRTAALLRTLPSRYQNDVVRVIGEHKGLFWEDLGEALDDVLNRAEPVVDALDGIDTADAALDVSKGDEWTNLRALSREYDEIRRDHLALLRVEHKTNFGSQSPAWAFAMLRDLSAVVPNFVAVVHKESRDLMGRPEELAFPVFDTGSVAHLLTVVRRRERLQPYIGKPEEALAAWGDASARVAEDGPMGQRPTGGRLAEFYGGEAGVARRYFG